jgi:hypothetical protein
MPKPSTSGDEIKVGRDPEFEAIIDSKASGTGVATDGEKSITARTKSSQVDIIAGSHNRSSSGATNGIYTTVTEFQDLPGTAFRVNGNSTRWKVMFKDGDDSTKWKVTFKDGGDGYFNRFGPTTVDKDDENVHYLPAVFILRPVDVQRWRSAREAMDRYDLKKPNKNLDLVTIKSIPESGGFDDTDGDASTWARLGARLGFTLVAASYGGLHALAWNAHLSAVYR